MTKEQMNKNERYITLTGGYQVPLRVDPSAYQYSSVATQQTADFPASFRLWTSGIKNQQTKGSCVAHALSTLKEIQEHYDTGDNKAFSVGWIYGYRLPTQYQGEGMYISEALSNLRHFGAVHKHYIPDNLAYSEITMIINDMKEICLEEAKNYKIANYAKVNNVTEIKHAIYVDHSPVVVGAMLYDSFYETDGSGIVKSPNITKEKNYGGHCMLIIGWTTINNKEYYVVQNSWGESFGDNGFCYIPINEFFSFTERWTVLDIQNYNKVFTDIKGRWSENYINKCVRSGLISGYEDGTFKPTNNITREEVCVLFSKLMEKFD